MGKIHLKLYGIWTSGSEGGCPLKTFFPIPLAAPLFSGPEPFVCNIGRSYHEEQFCEIILNMNKWFRRNCRLKVFLIWSSGSSFVRRSVTICAILVEGIMRNNSLKLYWIWVSGSDVVLKISYLELWWPSCVVERNHLCNFKKRASWGTFMCSYMKFGQAVQEMSLKDIS